MNIVENYNNQEGNKLLNFLKLYFITEKGKYILCVKDFNEPILSLERLVYRLSIVAFNIPLTFYGDSAKRIISSVKVNYLISDTPLLFNSKREAINIIKYLLKEIQFFLQLSGVFVSLPDME